MAKWLALAALCWHAMAAHASTGDRHGELRLLHSLRLSTHLLEVGYGGGLSDQARALAAGGFETSSGELIRFKEWYDTRLQAFRVTFLTEVSPSLGLIWGLSTGERGEKYRIEPSLKLGLAFNHALSPRSRLSVTASRIFGGRMRERTCEADFGEIGGIQTVNCRLAASQLPPEETLRFLVNESPRDKVSAMVRYSLFFNP